MFTYRFTVLYPRKNIMEYRYIRQKSLDEFYLRWLKNRVIERGKAISIPLIFSHLKWNPSYLYFCILYRIFSKGFQSHFEFSKVGCVFPMVISSEFHMETVTIAKTHPTLPKFPAFRNRSKFQNGHDNPKMGPFFLWELKKTFDIFRTYTWFQFGLRFWFRL